VRVLGHYAGPEPGAEALASAAARSYGELVRVVAPLIGHVGAASLTGRALHLAARAHPCLVRTREQEQGANPFAQVVACVRQQDPAVGTAAAAAVFAIFTSLLGTFIGERLTQRLLRKAWPDVFFDAAPEEIEERST
jgi:hypothetical protein